MPSLKSGQYPDYPEGLKNSTHEIGHFFSLVRPKGSKKRVVCLKCRQSFVGGTYTRTCGSCAAQNERAGARCGSVQLMPERLNEYRSC